MIIFDFEELPGEGYCSECKEPITGKMFKAYSIVGSNEDVTYYEYQLCEKCYFEPEKEKE